VFVGRKELRKNLHSSVDIFLRANKAPIRLLNAYKTPLTPQFYIFLNNETLIVLIYETLNILDS
jgi:hypothetical protein